MIIFNPLANNPQKKEEQLKVQANKNKRLNSSSTSKDEKISKSAFSETLAETIEIDEKASIDELLNDLKKQEERFLQYQNLTELNMYKAMIQKILKDASQDGYTTKSIKRPRQQRKADYVIIQQINTKLQDLTAHFISGNKGFTLFRQLEDIRGLICDLVY